MEADRSVSLFAAISNNHQQVGVIPLESYEDREQRKRQAHGVTYRNLNFRLLFYSPNELPSPLPQADATFIFGREPRIRKKAEWSEFLSEERQRVIAFTTVQNEQDLDLARKILVNNSLAVVESNPLSILEAAMLYQPSSSPLQRVHQELSLGRNRKLWRDFVDYVLAGKFLDTQGNLKGMPDYEGELLMFTALLGDSEAAMELSRRRQLLQNRDEIQFGIRGVDLSRRSETGLNIDDLVAVHVTNFLPFIDRDGQVYIKSTFDNSGFTKPRATIHFTLNHHVVSHFKGMFGGHWENIPYVLVTPLNRLIELNGTPVAIRVEDTYFATSPGEPLKLPEETVIIAPENAARGVETRVRMVPYSSQLTSRDLQYLAREWNNIFWGRYYENDEYSFPHYDPNQRLWSIDDLRKYYHPSQFDSLQQYLEIRSQWLCIKYQQDKPYYQQHPEHDPLKKDRIPLYRLPIVLLLERHNALRRFILDAMQAVPDTGISMSRQDRRQVVKKVEDDAREGLSGMLKVLTVNQVIRNLGFEVRYIDPYYLSDLDDARNYPKHHPDPVEIPAFQKKVEELAEKAGLSTQRHPLSSENETEWIVHALARIQEGIYEHVSFEERIKDINEFRERLVKFFPVLLPQTRRMHYAIGVY